MIEGSRQRVEHFFRTVGQEHLNRSGTCHCAVTPQKTSVGDVAHIAAGQVNQRLTLLGPVDKRRQIGLEGVQVIYGVFLSRSAGEQRFFDIHAAQVETHL